MKDHRFSAADTLVTGYETLIVIPTLNEEREIENVIRGVLPFATRSNALVVVADGGSRDRTRDIVSKLAVTNPHVVLMNNPDQRQSAGINLAVDLFGGDAEFLIRIDAHCAYPTDYCDQLVAEARATGADSVVVSMIAEGSGLVQRINAAAQNSRIGNGGSKHRLASIEGEFVDHGHHALMRMDAFRAIGGYDESFACNEDAELDKRLEQENYRIWLTARTLISYHPRETISALFGQYLGYGRGRAQNLLKHKDRPKLRQAILLGVFPAILLALLAPIHWIFAVPVVVWLIACVVAGVAISISERMPAMLLSSASAAVMHAAWSFGFWREVAARTLFGGRRRGA